MKNDFDAEIEVSEKDDALVYRIAIPEKQLERWIIRLTSLLYGMIPVIEIVDEKKELHVTRFYTKNKGKKVSRGTANIDPDMVFLTITNDELKLWLDFYLRKYHSMTREFDHIDVQIHRVNGLNKKRFYLTLS